MTSKPPNKHVNQQSSTNVTSRNVNTILIIKQQKIGCENRPPNENVNIKSVVS